MVRTNSTPALMYDDIAICNQIGVYKQGNTNNDENTPKGIFNEENSYLQSLKPKAETIVKIDDKYFSLYPNPANTYVNIHYELKTNEKGKFIIYDITGREMKKIELDNNSTKMQINISSLLQGIYTYKFTIDNKQVFTGKLIKE